MTFNHGLSHRFPKYQRIREHPDAPGHPQRTGVGGPSHACRPARADPAVLVTRAAVGEVNLDMGARLNLAAATVPGPAHRRTPTTGSQSGAHSFT